MAVALKITTNSDKFRTPALTFKKNGVYTFAPAGTSEYIQYWTNEMDFCVNGYTAEDGDYIPGYFYFYLNYFQINLVKEIEVEGVDGHSVLRQITEQDFPNFYDYDRFFFEAIAEAERTGKHLAVLKARRKGYSYKIASMLLRNFYFFKNAKGYALAAEKEFLVKDGILTKTWDGMDFVDQNTAWFKKKQAINSIMHKRASLLTTNESGVQIEVGYKSEIIGITLKNDFQKARGKKGKLIIFEEAGKFKSLLAAWQIARPSVEQGSHVIGTMIAFGCVCAGTKVYDKWGIKKNIEDVTTESGILGYNSYATVPLEVEAIREPYEADCYRITLNSGRILECSHDHPIVYSHRTLANRVPGKRSTNEHKKYWKWKHASDFQVGDQVGIAEEIPFFGNLEMWEPRLIGWLIGDGSYGMDKSPRMSNADKEINDYLAEHYDSVVEKEHITKDGRIYKETRIRRIVPFLRELGIYGQTKEKKRLPKGYDVFDRGSLAEMLGGLFDSDGYITDPYKRTEITLTAAHKEFLLEVLDLLQKFGINGKIQYIKAGSKGKGGTGHYRLTIKDKYSLSNFIENIHFFVASKVERAARLKQVLENITSAKSKYISGITFERVVAVENIGTQKVYNVQSSEYHTYIANGFITHNTGGTENSDFESLRELFERPRAYNCLEFDNNWEEGVADKCGFFIPQYANLEGFYMNNDDPSDPYNGMPFMDKDGNSNIEVAKKYILLERKKVIDNSSDRRAIDRHIAEQPVVPSEALLNISTNIFPKEALQRHLSFIRTHENVRSMKQVGELFFDSNGKLHWRVDGTIKDITKYRLSPGDDRNGAVAIWEHPPVDIPYGLYVIGVDPYDFDKSSTNSLGSCIVYKRFQGFEEYFEMPVAEYTGRPERADMFYEQVRMLAMYYNAQILYENEKKGLFDYMFRMKCEYLLADQPGIIKDIIKESTVQRGKGIHMAEPIKMWGEGAIRDWLVEEYAPGKKNLTKIFSEPLLEELISYNDTGNFDRVMAFMLVMIFIKELYHVKVKEKKEFNARPLFADPLFRMGATNDGLFRF